MSDPLNGDWRRLDEAPSESAQMIFWHAPRTAEVIAASVLAEHGRWLLAQHEAADVTRDATERRP